MNMDMYTETQGHVVPKKRRGLIFKGTEGGYDVYQYFKGDRPIFEASVDTTDPDLKIHVGKIGATWARVNLLPGPLSDSFFETKGRARWSSQDPSRISGLSVRTFVRPRAFGIFANLFVTPKLPTITEDAQGQH